MKAPALYDEGEAYLDESRCENEGLIVTVTCMPMEEVRVTTMLPTNLPTAMTTVPSTTLRSTEAVIIT